MITLIFFFFFSPHPGGDKVQWESMRKDLREREGLQCRRLLLVGELVSLGVLPQGGDEMTTRSSCCHTGEK